MCFSLRIAVSRRYISPRIISLHTPLRLTYIVASDTFNVCAGREEAPFAREHGEDGVWVVVEFAQAGDDGGDERAAEGVEGFGAVEL
jgi:hypothetical protein